MSEELARAAKQLGDSIKTLWHSFKNFSDRMFRWVKEHAILVFRRLHAHLEWVGDIKVVGHKDRRRLGRYIRQGWYEAWLVYRGIP